MTQWDLTNNAELCFDCSPKKHWNGKLCRPEKRRRRAGIVSYDVGISQRKTFVPANLQGSCLCLQLYWLYLHVNSLHACAGWENGHTCKSDTHTQCFYWPTLVIFYGEFLQVCDDPLYIYFFDDFWLRCRCAIVSSALWISAWVNSSIPAILFFCVFARRSKMIALTMKSRRAYAQISVTHLREESRTQIDILRTCHQCHQCHKIQCCSRFFRSQSFQRLRGEKVSKAEVPRL